MSALATIAPTAVPTRAPSNAALNPLRILLSDAARAALGERIFDCLGTQPHVLLRPAHAPADFDVALVTREVTGLSTKQQVLPATQHFYDLMLTAPSLRWVQLHSAGADRQVYLDLRARGVSLTSAAGGNAGVVAQSALAGVLALARHFPQLMAAQRGHEWAPLIRSGLPRDLAGQTAVIVGWGGIGQRLGALLGLLGLQVVVVRSSDVPASADHKAHTCATHTSETQTYETHTYENIAAALPRADWLLLACPLSPRTQGLIGASALALLPAGARVVNVARGEVIDEPALIKALQNGRLAGAYLDVFAQEPLPAESPLWDLANVIATPHSAGFSDGNAAKVEAFFLDNLARFVAGQPLNNRVS